ncbi:MAG: hypothetical protein WCC86_07755 [Methanoregula sp.]|uniref:hypothetical protein n=1 Tax=Methanoregula sp. TaxID=2052170 RepID=UPI003BB11A6A
MAAPQYLPIPETIHTLACETINRRVEKIPFTRDGIEITETFIDLTLECLNADATRTLVLTRRPETRTGLAGCLSERLGGDQSAAAPVIADVLVKAGLAEPTEVLDTSTHTKSRGIRLLQAWTWHIGSGDFLPTKGLYSGEETDAWLARCPVCKTGILSQVIGKRLFGIPPTDYYFDCSHCGAKFIPEKAGFRLVSIARIADPRWRQYLNSCKTPDEWAAIVREGTQVKQASQKIATSQYRMTAKKPEIIPLPEPLHRPAKPVVQVEGVPVHFPKLKDGSLVVTGSSKTLYFRSAKLRFLRGTRHDVFTHAERTLQQALENPAFSEVKPIFVQEYSRYLPLRLGPVAEELRRKKDPRLKMLLHRYGDVDFGSFALDDETQANQKGILIIFAQARLCHLAACHTTFADLVDNTFGNITADVCYRDGDETRCRINNLVTSFRDTPSIWFHEMEDDQAIDAAVADLNKRYLKVSEDTS